MGIDGDFAASFVFPEGKYEFPKVERGTSLLVHGEQLRSGSDPHHGHNGPFGPGGLLIHSTIGKRNGGVTVSDN